MGYQILLSVPQTRIPSGSFHHEGLHETWKLTLTLACPLPRQPSFPNPEEDRKHISINHSLALEMPIFRKFTLWRLAHQNKRHFLGTGSTSICVQTCKSTGLAQGYFLKQTDCSTSQHNHSIPHIFSAVLSKGYTIGPKKRCFLSERDRESRERPFGRKHRLHAPDLLGQHIQSNNLHHHLSSPWLPA